MAPLRCDRPSRGTGRSSSSLLSPTATAPPGPGSGDSGETVGGKQTNEQKPSAEITTAAGGGAGGRRARRDGLGGPTGPTVSAWSTALRCENSLRRNPQVQPAAPVWGRRPVLRCSGWEGRAVGRLNAEGSVFGTGGMSIPSQRRLGLFQRRLGRWAPQDKALPAGQRGGAGEGEGQSQRRPGEGRGTAARNRGEEPRSVLAAAH